jgi:hypothetical protein
VVYIPGVCIKRGLVVRYVEAKRGIIHFLASDAVCLMSACGLLSAGVCGTMVSGC